jgi:hypothetical protein
MNDNDIDKKLDELESKLPKQKKVTKKEYAQKAYDLMKAIPRDKSSNPLTLEGAIRSVILKSPDMAQYRDDALGILYCTLGGGISWIDGRLGDNTPNNYMNMPPDVGGQGCWSRDFGMDDAFDFMELLPDVRGFIKKRADSELKRAIITIMEIDIRCQEYRKDSTDFYPVSWYHCNLSAPPNAQEDFLLGALETATLICNRKPPLGTEKWITHHRTLSYAQEILKILTDRVGKK